MGKTRKHIKHMTKLKITKPQDTTDENAKKTQKHVKHKQGHTTWDQI